MLYRVGGMRQYKPTQVFVPLGRAAHFDTVNQLYALIGFVKKHIAQMQIIVQPGVARKNMNAATTL